MVAYAPSSMRNGTITVNAPHGCGEPHHLGDEAQPTLDCNVCFKHLTGTLGWGATPAETPETYDEAQQREYREKQGAKDVERATGTALEQMANMPAALAALPEGIGQAIAQGIAAALAMQQAGSGDTVRCPQDHPNPVAARFCAQCGASMGELVSAVVPDAPHAAVSAAETPAVAPAKAKPLKDWKAADLKAEARRLGLSDEGTRLEVLGRIKAAR